MEGVHWLLLNNIEASLSIILLTRSLSSGEVGRGWCFLLAKGRSNDPGWQKDRVEEAGVPETKASFGAFAMPTNPGGRYLNGCLPKLRTNSAFFSEIAGNSGCPVVLPSS